jgi:hypothetical protein
MAANFECLGACRSSRTTVHKNPRSPRSDTFTTSLQRLTSTVAFVRSIFYPSASRAAARLGCAQSCIRPLHGCANLAVLVVQFGRCRESRATQSAMSACAGWRVHNGYKCRKVWGRTAYSSSLRAVALRRLPASSMATRNRIGMQHIWQSS